MTDNEQILLKIAKEIIDLNPGSSLTGSLMLAVRGIPKRRESTDIDILIPNYAPNAILSNGEWIDKGYASDGSSQKYANSIGIRVDILSSDEEPELVGDVWCGSVDKMIECKRSYYEHDINAETKEKHLLDLLFLGVEIEQSSIADVDKLPF
jgi:hypothetical protein